MRIGLIAPPWTPIPPVLYGGIELVVDQLARGLQEAGHEVLLYTTGDSTCPVPRQWVLPEAEGQRIGDSPVIEMILSPVAVPTQTALVSEDTLSLSDE